MPEIVTEHGIAASPEEVWGVLSDLSSWPRWNPVVASLQGEGRRGARWQMGLRLGGREWKVGVTVLRWDPPREVVWRGGVRGLTVATHGLRLAATPEGCRLEHYERFDGVVPWVLWPWLRARLLPRYASTNEGLAAEVARRSGG